MLRFTRRSITSKVNILFACFFVCFYVLMCDILYSTRPGLEKNRLDPYYPTTQILHSQPV